MSSVYALKRKCRKLQEAYDLNVEELKRLRLAHASESDEAKKFKYEKRIEFLEAKQKQDERELEELEDLLAHPEKIPPFQWNYSTFPIDFSSKIDFLTKYFVGRQDAIERIEQFLQEHKSGYLAIIGEAGIGKSALLAHEVKRRGAVHHFVDDKQNSSKDEVFLRSIVEQLRQKYGCEFEERTPISASEWNIYFQKWLKAISAEEQLLIFVDALDEAQHYGGNDNLLKYLPQGLPENVYFILTSRPEFKKEEITFLESTTFERYSLPPLKQTDIETYLTVRSECSSVPNDAEAKAPQELAAILYEKSEGNPLYLYYLLQECGDENLTLEQVNQLPQGLTKFYEKQWRERIWTGDKATKESRKQLLCLLLLLKEPPDEGMLLELTDSDRADLREDLTPLGRFMRTGERYTIFHDSFKNFLQQQLGKTIQTERAKLIDDLWDWQELTGTLQEYALAWLPLHVFNAQQYDRLFALGQNQGFQQAQAQIFPHEPDLPLRTLQFALQAAVEKNEPVKMAEFLLEHAKQIEATKKDETPYEALKKGKNLERAWKLADLYDTEHMIQWHLLLACDLEHEGRLKDALETLERLSSKGLSSLTGMDGYLLTQIRKFAPQYFVKLGQQLLGIMTHYGWCEHLCENHHFAAALRVAKDISDESEQEWAFLVIAEAQAKNGSWEASLDAASKIKDEAILALTLQAIITTSPKPDPEIIFTSSNIRPVRKRKVRRVVC